MTTKILALDISLTSTGYVVTYGNKVVAYGTIATKPSNDMVVRVTYVQDMVVELLTTHNITEVAIEGPAYGARGAMSYAIFGIHFCVVNTINKYGIRPVQYAPTAVKKWVTGSGRATKEDMLKFVPYDLKQEIQTKYKKTTGLYDVVDAYHIAEIHRESLKK